VNREANLLRAARKEGHRNHDLPGHPDVNPPRIREIST